MEAMRSAARGWMEVTSSSSSSRSNVTSRSDEGDVIGMTIRGVETAARHIGDDVIDEEGKFRLSGDGFVVQV